MKVYMIAAFALLLSVFLPVNAEAQKPRVPEQMEERLEMVKKRFIEERLELTDEEADAFWPVYDTHQRNMDNLEEEYKKDVNPMFLSDEDAEAYLDNLIAYEQAALDERKNYMNEVRDVLPIRKTLFLVHLEEQFKREMVERIRKRLQDRPRQGPKRE